METIFYCSLIIAVVAFVANLIFKLIGRDKTKIDTFDIIIKALFNKITIVATIAAVVVYIFFSLMPYIADNTDKYLIDSYTRNISLYKEYITEYQESAQKQISEYQAAQSQMSKTATAIQLQYFSQQTDAISANITAQIKTFNELIMAQRIDINKATARMILRKQIKFYFY